jgi:hypothetical protein
VTLKRALILGVPPFAALTMAPEYLMIAVGGSMMWLFLDWLERRGG